MPLAVLPEPPPDAFVAWSQQGADRGGLAAEASALESRSLRLGRVLGALFGLVAALHLLKARFPGGSGDYETDPADCVSCARCFDACPYERVRRGVPVALPEKGGCDA